MSETKTKRYWDVCVKETYYVYYQVEADSSEEAAAEIISGRDYYDQQLNDAVIDSVVEVDAAGMPVE